MGWSLLRSCLMQKKEAVASTRCAPETPFDQVPAVRGENFCRAMMARVNVSASLADSGLVQEVEKKVYDRLAGKIETQIEKLRKDTRKPVPLDRAPGGGQVEGIHSKILEIGWGIWGHDFWGEFHPHC